MATHFSTIGLTIQSDDELIACVERVLPAAQKFPTPRGTYYRWADPSGAELWIQMNAAGELVGVNPHFGGSSRVRALLTHSIGAGTTLDGRFSGWADPAKTQPEKSGSYPFLFDAPDAACHAGLELPAEVDVQIAAFVHDVQLYANARAYDATQTSDAWHTSESFIPSGLLGPGEEVKAEAAFNGHVLRAERRTNRLSGSEFVWCLVRSTGGTFDVVADPEVMPAMPPVGGVISGAYWLSGRIGACERPSTSIRATDNWRALRAVESR